MTTDEMRREKARHLRYQKPICKSLNLWTIKEELDDIWENCDEVRYFTDYDNETLLNALDGDEEDADQFRLSFADLSAECERMREDLEEAYVPECFDTVFVAAGAGSNEGGYLGYDAYEQDYFGIDVPDEWIQSEGAKKLKRMTKDEIIECVAACLKVYQSYIGIKYRYDSLKAAFDILKNENTAHLRTVKKIDELYEKAQTDILGWGEASRTYDKMLEALPKEAWL